MGYKPLYSPSTGAKPYGLRALLPGRTSRAGRSVVMTLLLLISVWLFMRIRDMWEPFPSHTAYSVHIL